jgi:predicted TIM-barrel fold metal-dependent hydrolase
MNEIVDAHHHVWRYSDLPWLSGEPVPRIFGEYSAIRRDYPIDEYLEDIQSANVSKSIYVQTNWPTARAVDEVAWVQSIADDHGYPHGIVGFADLGSPQAEQVLTRQCQYRNFRGVRQQLHWHEKEQFRFAPQPALMNDPDWRRGFSLLSKLGLLFELQVFTSQMPDAARLVGDFPETIIVLEHAGMLEDYSPESWKAWRQGLKLMAHFPNVYTKLSGLNTFVHRCSVNLMQAIVHAALEIFGPQRCMFGSNFPIEKIWTDYQTLFSTFTSTLEGWTNEERAAVLGGTASRIYRL